MQLVLLQFPPHLLLFFFAPHALVNAALTGDTWWGQLPVHVSCINSAKEIAEEGGFKPPITSFGLQENSHRIHSIRFLVESMQKVLSFSRPSHCAAVSAQR